MFRIYGDYMYYAFSFVLPLLLLAVANGLVTSAYRRAQGRRRRLTRQSGDSERSITLVMILVVLLFIICQAPARVVQIVWSYMYRDCRQLRAIVIHASNMLEVLNSSLNFVVYCLFHRRFRAILRSYFCWCCGGVGRSCRRPADGSLSLADGATRGGPGETGTMLDGRTSLLRISGEGEKICLKPGQSHHHPLSSVCHTSSSAIFVINSDNSMHGKYRKFGSTLARLCWQLDGPDAKSGEAKSAGYSSASPCLSRSGSQHRCDCCFGTTLGKDAVRKQRRHGEASKPAPPHALELVEDNNSFEMKSLVHKLGEDGKLSSKCVAMATHSRLSPAGDRNKINEVDSKSSKVDDDRRTAFEKLKLEDPFGGVYMGPT
jgi:hypothetical protein